MAEGDWRDPFAEADDEAARERARRRAEREARRRERRRELADKAREKGSRSAPAPEPAPPEPDEPAPPPALDASSEPPEVPGPQAEVLEAPAPQAEPPEAPELEAEPPQAAEPEVEPPPGPELEPEPPDVDAPALDVDEEPRRRAPRRGGGGRPPREILVRRRVLAIGLLVAAAALAFFGVTTVAERLGGGGGGEEPPAEEVEEAISVTIPEGFDRRQIAAIADDAGLRGNYAQASRQAQGFNPGRFGADDPDSLEGFLFPATYEVRPNARVDALIARQLDAFRQRIREVDMSHPESRGLDVYDVLKIASMIDREVQIPKERRLVSAVIYNRLAADNPLGIDATIRYEDQNFDEPLTESRLNEPTPYNTRINAGLPPTPIGNPGIESIEAAANPANADHFYYVVKPGTCGEHFFTDNEEEFMNAVAEYQRALEEEGGAPTPDDC